MNKKKLIITIIIDLVAVASLAIGLYLLMFKELKGWHNSLATALVVVSLPVVFYSVFITLSFNKYGKLGEEDNKLWEEALKSQQQEDEK